MRARARLVILASVLASTFVWFGATGCTGNRAYLDWRPGLTELEFEGFFEFSLDEFDAFVADASDNTSFDRSHSVSRPDAAKSMAELGESLSRSTADPRGYAMLALSSEGVVALSGDRGARVDGSVDWFAITPDREQAALLTGTKLAVWIDGASTGIDIGSLVGGSLGGYQVMMVARDTELTVFTLPELGGVVTANEVGFVFAFSHRPEAREPWDISVARVTIKL